MKNYYNILRKQKRAGKMLKRKSITLKLVSLIIIVVVFISFFAVTAISCSKYLSTKVVFTVEVKSIISKPEYDYRNSNLNFFEKIGIKLFYKISNNVNIEELGNYSITYDSRLPFMQDYTHTIKLIDTTAPEFYLEPLDEHIIYKSIEEFIEPGYNVIDNYDEYVEVKTEISRLKPCWYTITYVATDKSGNVAKQSREINVVRGQVALTFDDGPSLNITPKILEILSENNVHATFFILGYDSDKAPLVLQEFTEGHTIGYHGMSHKYSDIYTSIDALMENFTSIEEDVIELTGYSSKIIRFPGGSSNTVSINYCKGIMSTAVNAVTDAGYTYFDWNVDSGDAGSVSSANEVYENVIAGIRDDHFNVILMHDSANKEYTLDALQSIIDYCVENDFELVKLDSLSPQIVHKVAN